MALITLWLADRRSPATRSAAMRLTSGAPPLAISARAISSADRAQSTTSGLRSVVSPSPSTTWSTGGSPRYGLSLEATWQVCQVRVTANLRFHVTDK